MKISSGIREQGIVVGNTYDKYGSRNLFVRCIMKKFDEALASLVLKVAPNSIHEIGCGEGYWVINWNRQGIAARGSDFSSKVIDLARANAMEHGIDPRLFKIRSIYDIEHEEDRAHLIVCCEVLEHLERPKDGLRALQRVTMNHLIVSVPREPIWRILNVVRGKYLGAYGNTPGHIQHWSSKGFIALLEQFFDVVETRTPVPWTMALCRVRR